MELHGNFVDKTIIWTWNLGPHSRLASTPKFASEKKSK